MSENECSANDTLDQNEHVQQHIAIINIDPFLSIGKHVFVFTHSLNVFSYNVSLPCFHVKPVCKSKSVIWDGLMYSVKVCYGLTSPHFKLFVEIIEIVPSRLNVYFSKCPNFLRNRVVLNIQKKWKLIASLCHLLTGLFSSYCLSLESLWWIVAHGCVSVIKRQWWWTTEGGEIGICGHFVHN